MFPRSPDDVTVPWLDGVLRDAGLAGGRLETATPQVVGTGQMGTSIRYTLGWAGVGGDTARSVVCKFASNDPTSRSTGVTLRTYEVEVGFYRDVAPTAGIRIPAGHFSDIDLSIDEFVLVLAELP